MKKDAGPLTVAAVDLGSNSFHMVIARFLGHDLHIVDRMREQVCLAAGLDDERHLTEEAQTSAVACLERIGERLRNIEPDHVRAVGTNTLRRARNSRSFRRRAERALGRPIEVISGQEEARLIYLGVAHGLGADPDQRLVVDIGGGSTEIILGEGYDVVRAHSLFMGSVPYTQQFFPDGALKRESFRKAEIAAGLELRAVRSRLREIGWRACIGSSGTINAIRDVLSAEGWGGEEITLAGLKKLRKTLIGAGHVDRLTLTTLKPARARVLPGGLAILIALFKGLGIESMSCSAWALREGLLYDILGRIHHEDARDRTIRRLVQQYHIDVAQAERVERTAAGLLAQLAGPWSLDEEWAGRQLRWASRLSEIGMTVAYTGHHKHGEYLVRHSELPGFSSDDQALLAALIRGERRKIPRGLFADLPGCAERYGQLLCVILRLAVLLNRGRRREGLPSAALDGRGALVLSFPSGWLSHHPLTQADLEQEALQLKALSVELEVREAEPALSREA